MKNKILNEPFIKSKRSSNNFEFIKLSLNYYRKEWKIALLILLIIVFFAISRVMVPLLTYEMTQSILNKVNDEHNNNSFWNLDWKTCIYIAIGIIVLDLIMTYIFNYIGYLMGRRIEIDLRNKTLEKLVRQDISYYSNKKIGEILTKVVTDSGTFGEWVTRVPSALGISITQIIVALTMSFIFDWIIALASGFIFFLLCLGYLIFYSIVIKKYEKIRLIIEEINGNVTDRISSIKLTKSSGTEKWEKKKFNKEHQKYYKILKPMNHSLSTMLTIIFAGELLIYFSTPILAAFVYGLSSEASEVINFFENRFAPYMLAQAILIGPLYNLLNASYGLAMASVSASQISTTLNQKSRLNPHYYNGIIISNIDKDIIFKNVLFSYPEKPEKIVLPKFNFRFELGKSYAFVGETGAGKSTIAKLLLRFYDPSQGKIIINNKYDLKDLNLSSYLKHIGYVEQEPQILYGDIYENVKYGLFDASDEQVIQACKKAGIHKLISSWPNGYKTILGERGFILSGGQKQRLVIARMFLKNPQILILDEATSALDNIVEKEIQAKLNLLMKNRTSITIAHRLSTIKHVDHIVVLGQDGKGIVQEGKFEILIKQEGPFKKLYKAGLVV